MIKILIFSFILIGIWFAFEVGKWWKETRIIFEFDQKVERKIKINEFQSFVNEYSKILNSNLA